MISIAVNWIFAPNNTVTGGLTGIGIILFKLTGIPIYITNLLLNIPLFLVGVWKLGGSHFGLKTLYGTLSLSLFFKLTSPLLEHPLTHEALLASIYGGLLLGLGLGIVFRGRATTGGTDLVARLLQHYIGKQPGFLLLFIDGSIILTAAIVFGVERVLYALISLFITSKTIDFVQEGISRAKVAYIITSKVEEVREGLLYDIDRGVTKLTATGGYTGEERPLLMCVVYQSEVSRLKDLIRTIDPNAFVIVSDAHEVLGEGFKPA
ncbi:YitT family protein [Fodinisporobacter ferrooxydans]|uniref:YitT family protein n=2 Tax=Fodinisporobacter ferrooxydans TaxID=2901836 RepID=A0ABY4CTM0_9BACL|nr:YitT family protein [Alicyclobacillaceae bacterium MYW30-H2]